MMKGKRFWFRERICSVTKEEAEKESWYYSLLLSFNWE